MEKVGKWNQVCFSSSKYSRNTFFGRGSVPDPAGGPYDALPDPLVGWGGGHPISFPSCYNPNCELSGLTLFFINMKQRLLTISVNTHYWVIFACLYWKSRGISCGLESGHAKICIYWLSQISVKISSMMSFDIEKCCPLASEMKHLPNAYAAATPVPDL